MNYKNIQKGIMNPCQSVILKHGSMYAEKFGENQNRKDN